MAYTEHVVELTPKVTPISEMHGYWYVQRDELKRAKVQLGPFPTYEAARALFDDVPGHMHNRLYTLREMQEKTVKIKLNRKNKRMLRS